MPLSSSTTQGTLGRASKANIPCSQYVRCGPLVSMDVTLRCDLPYFSPAMLCAKLIHCSDHGVGMTLIALAIDDTFTNTHRAATEGITDKNGENNP